MAVVTSIGLSKHAASIARSKDHKGAIVVTVGEDEVSIGVYGLTHDEIQEAVCTVIHYNFEVRSRSEVGVR